MAYDLKLSHPCYLPNTEQRIEGLKGVINKRPAPGAHRGAPPRDSDGREIITVRSL